MDEGVGNITAALKAQPALYANTVIFFRSVVVPSPGVVLTADDSVACVFAHGISHTLPRTLLKHAMPPSGDNGGQVTAGGNNWPLRGWKGSLWDGGARASAFIHSPLLGAAAGTRYQGLVHISDWFPTSLQLALDGTSLSELGLDGSYLPALLDGFDVWAALKGGKASPRTELLHEIDPVRRNERQRFELRASVRSGGGGVKGRGEVVVCS
jgi:arylsulfatase A-like enzyme